MVARLNGIEGESSTRARVNYYAARREEHRFPDPSLLDPVDSGQHADISMAVEKMINISRANGLSENHAKELSTIVNEHLNIVRTSLSAGPPADFPPLKIELTPDAKPVHVRLRKYSKEQREFLDKFVDSLVKYGMTYPNPTSPWACAPLLVPKPGPAKYRFTVDLRPIIKYTIRHQYPMPNLEQELTKLTGSKYYATFDFSHGYWQLPLAKESQPSQSFVTPSGVHPPESFMVQLTP